MYDMPYYQMMMGYPRCSPIASCPTADLEAMYPDIYHRIYPKVKHMCMMMDQPNHPEMMPCPKKHTVDRMAKEIYRQVIHEMGRCGEEDPMAQQDPRYRGDGFLQDLISIILIRELLFRRGWFF